MPRSTPYRSTGRQAARIPRPRDPFPPPTPEQQLIAILAATETCPPLTDKELSQAAVRRQRAPLLLATAAVAHCIESRNRAFAGLLDAYTAYEAATALGGHGNLRMSAREREANATWREAQKAAHHEKAGLFEMLIGAVATVVSEYEERYAPNGRVDRAAVMALYDRTEGLDHPILHALPSYTSVRDPERQGTLIAADRILHYLLVRAMPLVQAPDSV